MPAPANSGGPELRTRWGQPANVGRIPDANRVHEGLPPSGAGKGDVPIKGAAQGNPGREVLSPASYNRAGLGASPRSSRGGGRLLDVVRQGPTGPSTHGRAVGEGDFWTSPDKGPLARGTRCRGPATGEDARRNAGPTGPRDSLPLPGDRRGSKTKCGCKLGSVGGLKRIEQGDG